MILPGYRLRARHHRFAPPGGNACAELPPALAARLAPTCRAPSVLTGLAYVAGHSARGECILPAWQRAPLALPIREAAVRSAPAAGEHMPCSFPDRPLAGRCAIQISW